MKKLRQSLAHRPHPLAAETYQSFSTLLNISHLIHDEVPSILYLRVVHDTRSSLTTDTEAQQHRELLFFLAQFTAEVAALELIDATGTDVKVVTLTNGIVITTNTTNNPSFTVHAIVEGKRTRSVSMEWTNDSEGQTITHMKTQPRIRYARTISSTFILATIWDLERIQ